MNSIDPDHPFTSDLDIFGGTSLFQYFNRSATSLGKNRLAQWFQKPLSDPGTIRSRQAAVAEMAEKPEFRQEFLASGYLEKELPADKDDLLKWVEEPAEFGHWKFRFFVIFIPIHHLYHLISSHLLCHLSPTFRSPFTCSCLSEFWEFTGRR